MTNPKDARYSRLSLQLDDPDGHVGNLAFGLSTLQRRTRLDELLTQLPAVRASAAQALGLAAYQHSFGIYNHDQPRPGPLALVALHPKEDALEGSELYRYIRRYVNVRIHALYGLSLTEFLELPPYVVELLCEMAEVEAQRGNAELSALQQQLEQHA